MTDLLSYPDSPGFKERTTSRDAAAAIKPRSHNLRQMVLIALDGIRALTADQIADACGQSVLAIRPRVTELYRMGLIERTGARRKNASGMSAHVYRISNPRSGA